MTRTTSIVADPAAVAAVVAAVRSATSEQTERGTVWYADYGRRVRRAAREAGVPFAAACAIIGVSSINTRPEPGLRWAVATMAGHVGGHLPLAVSRAAAILAERGAPFDRLRDIACPATSPSRKVRSFACNVRTGGRECRHAVPCVTIDRWANFIATGRKDVPSGPAYERVAAAYREAAAILGLPVAIVQAIAWVTVAE